MSRFEVMAEALGWIGVIGLYSLVLIGLLYLIVWFWGRV